MRAKVGIVALVLSISVCAVTCNDHGVDTSDKKPKKRTFSKYYEPYESNIKFNAASYDLPLDINDIVNINKISQTIEFDFISSLIRKNGFAILELEPYSHLCNTDFVSLYRAFGSSDIPAFVTADTGLYLYHALFDETLKDINKMGTVTYFLTRVEQQAEDIRAEDRGRRVEW